MNHQLHLFTKRRAARPPLPLENKTHMAVVKTLRVALQPGWLFNHFPAGEYRDKVTAGKLKGMGLQPGWADFVLINPVGMHYWLELKRGKAPLSDPQLVFRDAMIERGVPYAVARSYEEAVGILNGWGAVRVRL